MNFKTQSLSNRQQADDNQATANCEAKKCLDIANCTADVRQL